MDQEPRNSSFTSESGEKLPDELPRFSLSPNRSISPIGEYLLELDNTISQSMCLRLDEEAADQELEPIFVSLHDIDAQITPLKASNKMMETIFEGVFLETPPRSGGRTVIPRRKCDPEDSSSDEDISPLCDSFMQLGEEEDGEMETKEQPTEIIMARRRITSSCGNSQSMVKQLLVASMSAEIKNSKGSGISSFCNSFQHRLNLIPGED